jgi:hypothetical protein
LGRQITNYATLLDDISRLGQPGEPTLLVTFNYDLMIEKALRNFGIAINQLPDYINGRTFKLIKLHGSVDWARQVTAPVIDFRRGMTQESVAKEIVEKSADIKVGPYHRMTGAPPHGIIEYQECGNPALCAAYPAIAIPVETKSYECPKGHLEVLEEFLPKVTKILVIGWRGAEKYFRSLLDNLRTEPRVMVVSPGEADQTIAKMREVTRLSRAEFQPVNGGFSEFTVGRFAEDFLRS